MSKMNIYRCDLPRRFVIPEIQSIIDKLNSTAFSPEDYATGSSKCTDRFIKLNYIAQLTSSIYECTEVYNSVPLGSDIMKGKSYHRLPDYMQSIPDDEVLQCIPRICKITRSYIQNVLDDKNIYEFTMHEDQIIPDLSANMYIFMDRYRLMNLKKRFLYMKTVVEHFMNMIDFDSYNENGVRLVLAGGVFSYLMSIAVGVSHFTSDFDLFIVGTREQAFETINKFLKMKYQMYITENCITAIIPCGDEFITVQLILRYHDTPEQVIEQFDLAPAMVFYCNHRFWYNAEAKFSYTHGCMLANIERRRANYSYRIKKYMQRNIGLLLYDCKFPNEFGEVVLEKIAFRRRRYINEEERNPYQRGVSDRRITVDLFMVKDDDVQHYYCSEKVYSFSGILGDNIKAGAKCTSNSGVAGVASIDGTANIIVSDLIDFKPFTSGVDILVARILERIYQHILGAIGTDTGFHFPIHPEGIVKELYYQRLITNEENKLLSSLCRIDLYNEFKACLTHIFEKHLARLPRMHAYVYHCLHPMYMVKCQFIGNTADYYGKYYCP